MMDGRAWIVIAFFLCSGVKGLNDATKEEINAFIENLLTCRDVVGMNLAIVHNKETVMTNGYGVVDLEGKQPVSDKTLFGIASLTKAFTTTLLGQMIAQYGLTWDLPVREMLGEEFFFYDGMRSNKTTLRDLAAHTTGIPNNNNMRMQDGLTKKLLAEKMRFFKPTSDFRTTLIYNNLMYGLMSYITEVIGGKSWEELTWETIFSPLSMTSSTFTHEADLTRPDIAKPYLTYDGEFRPVDMAFQKAWGELGGSGSILSNAQDMAQWLHLQLNEGKSQEGKEVIWRDVLKETHTPKNLVKQGSTANIYKKPILPVTYDHSQYALGWRVGYYRGNQMVLHTGTSWGYGALLTLLPDLGIGIYSSVTGPDDGYLARRTAHMYIMDLLLGETPWLNHTTACTFPEPWAPAKTRRQFPPYSPQTFTEDEIEKYVGTYGNFGYGNVTFLQNVTSGVFELHYGEIGLWELSHSGNDTFSGKGKGLIWARDIKSILFEQLTPAANDFYKVTISFESRDPPVFIRGLKMSDAPAPPDPSQCGSDPDVNYLHYSLVSGADLFHQKCIICPIISIIFLFLTYYK